jgi:hypothetical protein
MKKHHLLASNFGVENFIGKINKFKINKINYGGFSMFTL